MHCKNQQKLLRTTAAPQHQAQKNVQIHCKKQVKLTGHVYTQTILQ